jgi:hypothetical protein
MLAFEEAEKILSQVECSPYELRFDRLEGSDKWFLQVRLWRPDTVTGEWGWRSGGKYYVSPHSTPGELVRKCLAAVLAYAEHEVRENFLFRGRRVFGPHILKPCGELQAPQR